MNGRSSAPEDLVCELRNDRHCGFSFGSVAVNKTMKMCLLQPLALVCVSAYSQTSVNYGIRSPECGDIHRW